MIQLPLVHRRCSSPVDLIGFLPAKFYSSIWAKIFFRLFEIFELFIYQIVGQINQWLTSTTVFLDNFKSKLWMARWKMRNRIWWMCSNQNRFLFRVQINWVNHFTSISLTHKISTFFSISLSNVGVHGAKFKNVFTGSNFHLM